MKKDIKEVIVFGVCLVIIYICVTIAEVAVVIRSLDNNKEEVMQQLERCPAVTESLEVRY